MCSSLARAFTSRIIRSRDSCLTRQITGTFSAFLQLVSIFSKPHTQDFIASIMNYVTLCIRIFPSLPYVWQFIFNIFLLIYFQHDATLHNLFISGKLLYMFRVVSPPIISSTHNCIYSIWYLSNCYCYLQLMWKSWNRFERGVGIVLICFGAVATAPKQITHTTLKPVPTFPQ